MSDETVIDERAYLTIRNLQIVTDVQAILENLDHDVMPDPYIGTFEPEFHQLRDILIGWEKRLRERINVA